VESLGKKGNLEAKSCVPCFEKVQPHEKKKGYTKEYLPSLIFKEEEYSGAGIQRAGEDALENLFSNLIRACSACTILEIALYFLKMAYKLG